ncbi:DUF995 domain-containing protein [Thalassospira australica]|uniref:DUF995 domain-containing protein n=1 Tax=Thalassospira australica TaxID=1528106 RepID=UPI0009DDCB41|nr:DUF995 domain-containing protein [Thalassospira australica]
MIGKVSKLLIAASAIASLAACQTTSEMLAEDGATQLTAWEITSTLDDTTRAWASGNGMSYYAADGAYLWKTNGGDTGDGTWMATDDDQMCFTVETWNNGNPQCYTMYKKSDGSIVSVDGAGKLYPLGAFQKGNKL